MFRIYVVGKPKDKALLSKTEEFIKRISRYYKIELIVLKEGKGDSKDRIDIEEDMILKSLKPGYNIILDENGKNPDTRTFSDLLDKKMLEYDINIVIGGPLGLSKKVLDKADYCFSLSKLTFTHEMALFLLSEQIYRSVSLLKGLPYHKK